MLSSIDVNCSHPGLFHEDLGVFAIRQYPDDQYSDQNRQYSDYIGLVKRRCWKSLGSGLRTEAVRSGRAAPETELDDCPDQAHEREHEQQRCRLQGADGPEIDGKEKESERRSAVDEVPACALVAIVQPLDDHSRVHPDSAS